MHKADRLLTLDAMRGLAAILVLVYHFHETREARIDMAASGYLAVDFFFLLSGFVIARTYDTRLANGLSFVKFAALRVVRLHPLFLVGLAIGFVRCVGQIVLNKPEQLSATELTLSALFGLFILPSPGTRHISPLNGPGWSLIFELAINLVYASALARAGMRVLVIVAAVSGALYAWAAFANGTIAMGVTWDTFGGGLVRVCFSFTVGAIIARVHRTPVRDSRLAVLPMLALVALLVIPTAPAERLGYELFVSMLAAPALVWFGASYNPFASIRRVCQSLGELSYPVYAIHYPAMWMFGFAARKAGVPNVVWMPAFVVLIVLVAWALDRYWDAPLRRRLNDSIRGWGGRRELSAS